MLPAYCTDKRQMNGLTAAFVSTLLLLVVVVRLVVEGGEAPEDEADAQSMAANKSC